MGNKLLSTKVLEDILQQTVSALEEGRSQIYDVAEAARQECDRTEVLLQEVRLETEQAIITVEQLEKEFGRARFRLFTVNKEFNEYSEAEKKDAYEVAISLREDLNVAKERERMLRVRRDSLEQTFAKLQDIATKAERLVSQVGVALNYLSGNIHDVNEQIEQLQTREYLGQQILQAQELERKRMASSLHDGPVQDLANLVVQLEICERLYHDGRHSEIEDSFGSLKEIARSCMGEMRRIIYDLNPMSLEDLGLVATIKNLLENLEAQTEFKTRFNLLGKVVRLDSQVEVNVFRLIQEAVNNSRKHSQGKNIEVTMEFLPQQLNIGVKDDGIGFVLKEVQDKLKAGGHYGLLSLQNRTKILNGTISMRTNPGEGTRILMTIPLNGTEWRSADK